MEILLQKKSGHGLCNDKRSARATESETRAFSRVTSRRLIPTFNVAAFLAVRHDKERVVQTAYTRKRIRKTGAFCFSQHSGRNAQSFHRQEHFCRNQLSSDAILTESNKEDDRNSPSW